MTRRQRRRGGNTGDPGWQGPAVITANSDDEEDSDYLPAGTTARADSPEVVLILDQSPGPRACAAEAAAGPAAAASPAKAKTLTPLKRPAAAAADAGAESDGDDSGSGCIICMELMSEQGSHRPATLKCGHIFGEGCIRRWLREKSRCPQCNKPSKIRDVTALFNLPKKVAAGNAGAAAELEQQLQRAQQQAEREQKRAQQLEQQLKRMQQELSRQQQPQQPQQQPPWLHMPQQLHVAGAGWQGPGSSVTGAAQAMQWMTAASQLLSGHMLSDADFAAFKQHPNTQMLFGGAPPAMPQHSAQHWLQQPHVLQATQQMMLLQQLALDQQQGMTAPPALQQQQSSTMQQQQQPRFEHAAAQLETSNLQQLMQQQMSTMQQVQQQQQRLFGRQLPAAQHTGPGPGGAAAGRSSTGALSAAAAAGAAAVARASSADAASTAVPLQPLQGAAAAGSGSVRKRVLELCFAPIRKQPCSHSANQSTQQFQPAIQQQLQQQAVQQLVMPGGFSLLQEFELAGSRAFDLDVEGTLLTVAEVSGSGVPPPMAISRLRRISMLAPGCPSHTPLPREIGTVRCLARQPLQPGAAGSSASALMAVATDRAGLIIAKPSTNNVVATIATRAPIWSVAWSSSSEQQLLLGVDKGRLALVDLRMTGDRALLYMSPLPAAAAAPGAAPGPSQPWHSLLMLPQDWQQQHAAGIADADAATPEALLASAGGVYCWSSAQPDRFQLLLPSSLHGGQCEALALAPDGCTVAASFRQPLGHNRTNCQPVHYLMQLGACQLAADAGAAASAGPAAVAAGAEATAVQASMAGGPGESSSSSGVADAVAAGRRELLASTLQLTGHSSQQLMTRGCFMPGVTGLPGEQLLFASADEQSCMPRLWGCSSRASIRQQVQWQRMSSPVLQVAGGTAAAFNAVLLGTLSERQLKLYSHSG